MSDYEAINNVSKQIKKLFGLDARLEYCEFLPGKVVVKVWHGLSVNKYIAKVEGNMSYDGKLWDIKECE